MIDEDYGERSEMMRRDSEREETLENGDEDGG